VVILVVLSWIDHPLHNKNNHVQSGYYLANALITRRGGEVENAAKRKKNPPRLTQEIMYGHGAPVMLTRKSWVNIKL